ncbi:unnamed protein product [Adineta ricciae]|uniref:Uncharacterized protein n=1 Tax=Adineta ricciae TaxID=249248 RepID=A0A815TYP2_ADIRI|nr:unnamed protein product [Adineta ricciae]CAF1508555.1 unnamed protein product [Adineta ricciae]
MRIFVYFTTRLLIIKNSLLQLNLFRSGSENESIIRNERRTTRIFLLLFLTSLIGVTLYYSLISQTQLKVIPTPTLTNYTALLKEVSLQCPCRQIAVKLGEFIRIKPSYHELCQSDLISDEYIHQLHVLYEQSWNRSIETDIHRIVVFQFQTLRKLCQLTRQFINDSLQTFLQNEFVQTQIFPSESVEIQMTALLTDFTKSSSRTFLTTLKFIQDTTAQSLLLTGASMTSVLPEFHEKSGETPYQGVKYKFRDGSSCTCSSSTANNCMGLSTLNNGIVPGFQTGCYMFSALLNSTLEIFYDQTWINMITKTSNSFRKLNSSNPNLTVEELLKQMFVIDWSNETIFENYFNKCAPDYCQYTITSRQNFLFIVTKLIGFLGGLSALLKMISPFLIKTLWPIIRKFLRKGRTSMTQNMEINTNTVLTIDERLKRSFDSIKQKLIQMNLFKSVPPSEDENLLQFERLVTRLYLMLFVTSLIIITIIISVEKQQMTVIVDSPTLNDFLELHHRHSHILECPCDQIAIDYGVIFRIESQYHEVCSSPYVTSEWINVKYFQSPTTKLITTDFRYLSQFHFQLLSTLCRISDEIIRDSLQSFYRTKFITNRLLNQQSFRTQIDSLISDFQKNILVSFQHLIELIRTNLQINQFITPMNSAFSIPDYDSSGVYVVSLIPVGYHSTEQTNHTAKYCSSLSFLKCHKISAIVEDGFADIIPGMVQTWFPFEALLMSTLECFYDDKCLNKLKQVISEAPLSKNLTKLQSTSSSNRYDRIEILANHLFIHSWTNESFYETYFNQCHPLQCQYTFHSRLNLIDIIITLIGFLGGINIVLRFTLPRLTKMTNRIYERLLQRQQSRTSIGIFLKTRFSNHIRALLLYSKNNLIELNYYPTIPSSNHSKIQRRNRHKTRIYLILFVTCFSVFLLYTSLKQENVTISVEYPSLSTYEDLFVKYPLTLKCPCSRVAIKHKEFVHPLEPKSHPICSSTFISQDWLNSLPVPDTTNGFVLTGENFHDFIYVQFQALGILCKVSRTVLNISLSTFEETSFITAFAISSSEFNFRTKSEIEQFQHRTSNEFVEMFKLIQITNHANQLASLFYTNWIFVPKYLENLFIQLLQGELHVLSRSKVYMTEAGRCSCSIQQNCSVLSTYELSMSHEERDLIFPGFRHGCFMFDALLQSTLSCLYNETCLTLLQSSILYSKPIPINILTDSSLSNVTIEAILSEIFVSQWVINVSFALYYNNCAPKLCQYSHLSKSSLANLITISIAAFGSLTNGLHVFVHCLATIVYKIIDRRKRKTHVLSVSQTEVVPLEEVRRPKEIRRDRAMLFCLTLLGLIAIGTAFAVLFSSRKKENQLTFSAVQTTAINNIISTTELKMNSSIHMTFYNQSLNYSTGHGPAAFVTGDFDHDSLLDLAVTNADSDTISILLGNHDGTFQTQRIISLETDSKPEEILTGDLNNDTYFDLIILLSSTRQIILIFGSSSNVLFLSPPYHFPYDTSENIPSTIAIGDMNNDGFLDIIVCRELNDPFHFNSLSVCLNLGNGYDYNCIPSGHDIFSTTIISIVIDDLDNNGKKNDFVWLNKHAEAKACIGSTGLNSLSYECIPSTHEMFQFPSIIITGKFNSDNFPDFALLSSRSDTLQIILHHLLDNFWWEDVRSIYRTANYPTSLTRINFNNDLIDDLALLHCDGTVTIFLGTEIGLFNRKYLSFQSNQSCSNPCCHSIKSMDLNRDGKDDLIFLDKGTNSVRVLMGVPYTK